MNTSGDDRNLPQIKQNTVTECAYIGPSSHNVWLLKSLPFFRSSWKQGFCFGTGSRKKKVYNQKIKVSISWTYDKCTLLLIGVTTKIAKQKQLNSLIIWFCCTHPVRTGSDGRQHDTRQTHLQSNVFHKCKFRVLISYSFEEIARTKFAKKKWQPEINEISYLK